MVPVNDQSALDSILDAAGRAAHTKSETMLSTQIWHTVAENLSTPTSYDELESDEDAS